MRGVYYSLLKHSGTTQDDALAASIDALCAAALSMNVPLQTRFDGLVRTAQDLKLLGHLEVAQCCAVVDGLLRSTEEEPAVPWALVRALEAAAVAYAIGGIFSPAADACPSWRQELLSRGDQVLQEVAARVDAFRLKWFANTCALDSTLHGLLALKRAAPDAYAVLAARQPFRQALKEPRIRKTLSTYLTEAHQEMVRTPKQAAASGRGAFQLEVVAGMERLDFSAPELTSH